MSPSPVENLKSNILKLFPIKDGSIKNPTSNGYPLLAKYSLKNHEMLMNAAPRFVVPQPPHSRRPAASSRVIHSKAAFASSVTSMPSRSAGQNVTRLNTPQRLIPAWLRSLRFLHRSSDIVTFLLIATTLTVYSWTVYTQQQWSQEYRKLQNLQRQERHLTTANETMKDQLAQQAERPATGLVTPTHANAIFLTPAPQRQSPVVQAPTAESEPAAQAPLGY